MTKQEESNLSEPFFSITLTKREDGRIDAHCDFKPTNTLEELAIIKFLEKQLREIIKI